MAMIKTGMGMLVDMTVPTHVGPYTDFPVQTQAQTGLVDPVTGLPLVPGDTQPSDCVGLAPGDPNSLTTNPGAGNDIWQGPGTWPSYCLPAGNGLPPDSPKGGVHGRGPGSEVDRMRKEIMSSYGKKTGIPVDGFAYNPFTILTPYNYYAGALSQMDTLRRANTYRPRWYCIPDDFNQPLQAYETLEYQIKVTGGSYLWGMRFIQYSSVWTQQAPSNVVVQISEACTGIELFREFSSPAGIAFYTAGTFGRGFHLPHILTQPRLFLEPGDVDIEMCNLSGDTQSCQLTLYFAEPADIVEQAKLSGRI